MQGAQIVDQEEHMRQTLNGITAITTAVVLVGIALLSVPASAGNTGDATFKAKCAACHGPDGKGETAVGKSNKVRDLGSLDVQKQSDDELSAIIGNGKGKMPAYGKSLNPEQIKELVAYIRTLKK
jgi:cytochrome c6